MPNPVVIGKVERFGVKIVMIVIILTRGTRGSFKALLGGGGRLVENKHVDAGSAPKLAPYDRKLKIATMAGTFAKDDSCDDSCGCLARTKIRPRAIAAQLNRVVWCWPIDA